MSVFVDTGVFRKETAVLGSTAVFYAYHDTDAERHDEAVTAFEELLDGAYGQPYSSDYVLDETVTLTRVRTGSFDAADTVARRMLGEGPFPDVVQLVNGEPAEVTAALETFRRYDDPNSVSRTRGRSHCVKLAASPPR